MCLAKVPINQFCTDNSRLLSHRVVGAGKRSQGRAVARATRGTPRKMGLIKWSNRLSVMVRLKGLLGVFLCFVLLAHWDRCELKSLGELQQGR